jgi:NAD+ synthase (glutamine-hydrolysing)
MSLPIFNSIGTTGQDVASTLAFNLVPGIVVKNLSDLSAVANNTVGTKSPFSVGQVDYWLRPVVLYGLVARLQAANIKAVVVGTINRDEGSYIGYFGKHTDICDVQVISDLHKSEVYQVAKHYNVPDSIINRAPEGNVHNAKTDEELIGTSYDMVELYTGYYLQNPNAFQMLNQEEKGSWMLACQAVEKRRSETYFKYDNGLSCYFIDVLERKVPNGWQ